MSTSGIKRLLGLAFFCAAVLFLTAAWSRSTPLPAFTEALASYRDQTRLALGGRDGFLDGESFHRRNYVLLLSFKFVEVTQIGSGSPKIREEDGGFVLLITAVFVVLFWGWWRRSEKAGKGVVKPQASSHLAGDV